MTPSNALKGPQTAVFSTQTPGIGGMIKLRYSDFIVEEIDSNGRICEVKRFLGENASETATPIQVPAKPEDREYSQLHCDLEKFNCDINFCLQHISRFLGTSKKRIGYAGLKDKRAITCQRISLFDPNLERLALFRSRAMDLRNIEWKKERIEIGDLGANRFTITIRNLELDETGLKKRIDQFFAEATQNGVANFFGEQRFGGIRNNTHTVGKLLLQGNLEEGILQYLTQVSEKEPAEISKIREQLAADRNFSNALKAFPINYRFERTMCQHLHNYPNDYAGALQKLPKHLRYLFSHAWQSHLFNQLLVKRLQSGQGLNPTAGDRIENNEAVLPLLGYDSLLDAGKLGELEQEVLDENDFSLSQFKSLKIPEISSSGSYRAIALRPQNLELVSIGSDEFNPGKQKAIVRFELPKGTYATTLLAELQKNA